MYLELLGSKEGIGIQLIQNTFGLLYPLSLKVLFIKLPNSL
jgi:hypothetical protein